VDVFDTKQRNLTDTLEAIGTAEEKVSVKREKSTTATEKADVALDSYIYRLHALQVQAAAAESYSARVGREVLAALDEWGAAEVDLLTRAQAAEDALLTPLEAITVERDRQIEQIDELAAKTGDLAAAERATTAIRAKAAQDVADIEIAQRRLVASAYAETGDKILEYLQQATAASKNPGMRKLNKIAIIAGIIKDAAIGIGKDLALGPKGIPLAVITTGLALAASTSVAMAKDIPSYATGDLPPMRHRERLAYVGEDEAVLTPRGRRALGDETIRAAERGRPSPMNTLLTLDGSTTATAVVRRVTTTARLAEQQARFASLGRLGYAGRA
jgi:hypothetical protein